MRELRQQRRIVIAVTSDRSLRLLSGFPEHLQDLGWDVHVVSDGVTGPSLKGVVHHSIPMRRDPALIHDLVSLLRWVVLLAKLRPAVVSAGTPKAGLLGTVAAWFTRVPVRVYMLRGLRLSTEVGRRRHLFNLLERMTAGVATSVLAVSSSLRDEFVSAGLAMKDKVVVLGPGSSNGVVIPAEVVDERDAASFTVGFVGRLHRDKGVDVLINAVQRARAVNPAIKLLLVGGEEPVGYLSECLDRVPGSHEWVRATGHVNEPEKYYPRMDLLALITKREGFPNVVLEAAAHGVPTLATAVTGCVDAVTDGVTGVLIPTVGIQGLAQRIVELSRTDARGTFGRSARQHVAENYERTKVWRRYADFYNAQVDSRRVKAS